jgi:hypothetical protein
MSLAKRDQPSLTLHRRTPFRKANRATEESYDGQHVTANSFPLSEAQCHAQPVVAHVGSLCSRT